MFDNVHQTAARAAGNRLGSSLKWPKIESRGLLIYFAQNSLAMWQTDGRGDSVAGSQVRMGVRDPRCGVRTGVQDPRCGCGCGINSFLSAFLKKYLIKFPELGIELGFLCILKRLYQWARSINCVIAVRFNF